jgi:hypothetical protein
VNVVTANWIHSGVAKPQQCPEGLIRLLVDLVKLQGTYLQNNRHIE